MNNRVEIDVKRNETFEKYKERICQIFPGFRETKIIFLWNKGNIKRMEEIEMKGKGCIN